MAHFSKQSSLLVLIVSLLSYSHVRESQFFNKASAATNNDVVSYPKQPETSPQPQQPNFLPDNEPAHGLYDRLPPSTHKYLPRNYIPVAYVTQPESMSDNPTLTARGENNNLPDVARDYYITPEEQDPEYRNNTTYVNGGGTTLGLRENTFGAKALEPQGMSNTRWVENGKYYYDIEAEKYNNNHLYESLKRSRTIRKTISTLDLL